MPKQRQLSEFLCREMLYDFATDELDADREEAVRDYIKKHPDMATELEAIKQALDYNEKLSMCQISQPFVEEIKTEKKVVREFISQFKWSEWPDQVKWTIEAVTISVVVGLLAIIVPWDKVSTIFPDSGKAVLVEVDKKQEPLQVSTDVDEEVSEQVPDKKLANVDQSKISDKDNSKSKNKEDLTTKLAEAKSEKATKEDTEETESANVAVKEEEEDSKDKKLKGYVYRLFMGFEDLEPNAEKIKQKFVELGGQKAGKVPLGWTGRPNGRYFHFKMPENNYDEMIAFLKDLGQVQIYKDPHRRVMPEGVVRGILWVEDSGKN